MQLIILPFNDNSIYNWTTELKRRRSNLAVYEGKDSWEYLDLAWWKEEERKNCMF